MTAAGRYDMGAVNAEPSMTLSYKPANSRVWSHPPIVRQEGTWGAVVKDMPPGKYQVKAVLNWTQDGLKKSVETDVVEVTVAKAQEESR